MCNITHWLQTCTQAFNADTAKYFSCEQVTAAENETKIIKFWLPKILKVKKKLFAFNFDHSTYLS